VVQAGVSDFIEHLPRDKFEIVDLDLTELLSDASRVHEEIYHKALSYYFKIEREAGDNFSPIMREIFAVGDLVSPETYRNDLEVLPTLRQAFTTAAETVDVICVASTASTAPRRGEMEIVDSSRYWTMLHLPTLSLPLFIDDKTGLPFGAQLVGTTKFSEPLLFRFLRDAGIDSSALRTFR